MFHFYYANNISILLHYYKIWCMFKKLRDLT